MSSASCHVLEQQSPKGPARGTSLLRLPAIALLDCLVGPSATQLNQSLCGELLFLDLLRRVRTDFVLPCRDLRLGNMT